MIKNTEIKYSTNDVGREVATIRVSSANLPMIHIDTYQTFTGDSTIDYELDYLYTECGLPEDIVEIGVENFSQVLRDLAETSNNWVAETLEDEHPTIVTVGEVLYTHSPAAYNFATDEYDAEYSIDLELMEAWITEHKFDYEAYGLETFKSYSGFHSHVPYYLQRDDMSEGVRLWLFLHAYMSDVFGYDSIGYYKMSDDWFYTMMEAETEVYSEQLRASWSHYGVRDIVEQRLVKAGIDEDKAYDIARWHDEPNLEITSDTELGERFNSWLNTVVKHYTKTDEGKK